MFRKPACRARMANSLALRYPCFRTENISRAPHAHEESVIMFVRLINPGNAGHFSLPCRVGSSRHNQVKAEASAKTGAFDFKDAEKCHNSRTFRELVEPVVIDRDFFERQWWGNEGES